jgi:hypothetical protein
MHTQPNRDLIAEDRSLQQALIAHLLSNYPAQFSPDELKRDLGQPNPDTAAVHVDDAITALVAAGLMHRNGDLVVASWAAKYFDDLIEGS